jgi:DNA-binding MarR family transcriptional regulator
MTTFSQDENFIERCPHDEDNPYTLILNALIRNESLSPDCRWLLIYLLSNKKDWKISIGQIVKHLKNHKGYARGSIYKLVNEAIEAGYIKREQCNNGKYGKVKYFLSEKPKFKKCLPRSLLPHAESSRAVKREHKKELVLSYGKEPVAQKKPPLKKQQQAAVVVFSDQEKESIERLRHLGFDKQTCEVMRHYSLELINRQAEEMRKANQSKEISNPLGWLRKAIEGDWKSSQPKKSKEQEEKEKESEMIKKNKAIAEKLKKEFKHLFTEKTYFDVSETYINFFFPDSNHERSYWVPNQTVSFWQNGCLNYLKKFINEKLKNGH